MGWFNYYGLIFIAIIMIPNIVLAMTHKQAFESKYKNKAAEISEQTGRFGCIAAMIFNIPFVTLGFWFDSALTVYLIVNVVLVCGYCLAWLVFAKKNNLFKALSLSVIPSLVFIFSGIALLNFPLIVFSALFSIGHITVSVKNAQNDV